MEQWNEKLHPRKPDGKFGDGPGGASRVLTGKSARESLVRPSQIPGVTDSEETALIEYQAYAHPAINDYLRHGATDNAAKWHDRADKIRSMFAKSPPTEHPIKVFRGVGGADRFLGPVGSKKGQEFTDRGVVSTTTSRGVLSDRFSHDTTITINVPAGMRAIRPQSDTVEGLDEQEVLLPPGTRFRVTSDRMSGGQRRVALDVVDTPTDRLDPAPAREPIRAPEPQVPAPSAPKQSYAPGRLGELQKSLDRYNTMLNQPNNPPDLKTTIQAKIKQIKLAIKQEQGQ